MYVILHRAFLQNQLYCVSATRAYQIHFLTFFFLPLTSLIEYKAQEVQLLVLQSGPAAKTFAFLIPTQSWRLFMLYYTWAEQLFHVWHMLLPKSEEAH